MHLLTDDDMTKPGYLPPVAYCPGHWVVQLRDTYGDEGMEPVVWMVPGTDPEATSC